MSLPEQTGDPGLGSKHLCDEHARALQAILAEPIPVLPSVAGRAIPLLRAAESDLDEAGLLDPSLPRVEENLERIRAVLSRLDQRPRRPRRAAEAAVAEPEPERAPTPVEQPVPRTTRRVKRKKKPRRRAR